MCLAILGKRGDSKLVHNREFQKFSLIIENSCAKASLKKSGKHQPAYVFSMVTAQTKCLPSRTSSGLRRKYRFMSEAYQHAQPLKKRSGLP
jgi:hypothetical protein